ncbi:peptidase C13 family protein [Cryptosporidium serpentis]
MGLSNILVHCMCVLKWIFAKFIVIFILYFNILVELQFTLGTTHHSGESLSSNRNNNWGLIVSTSRYWFNYRHTANALSFYRLLKDFGIPDERIILMLAEDTACNPRNCFPGKVFVETSNSRNLYNSLKQISNNMNYIEVDYKGQQVNVENFLRVLLNKHERHTPKHKRLLTDFNSNIFMFLTGHGGEEFLKFQDYEEITSQDIAYALELMQVQNRYKRILIFSDTCQAGTLHKRFYSKGVISLGCSGINENSYSHHFDRDIGVAVIDRFSYYSINLFRSIGSKTFLSIPQFVQFLHSKELLSQPELKYDISDLSIKDISIMEFISSSNIIKMQNTHSYASNNALEEMLEIKNEVVNSCYFYSEIYKIQNTEDQTNSGEANRCIYIDPIISGIRNIAKSMSKFNKSSEVSYPKTKNYLMSSLSTLSGILVTFLFCKVALVTTNIEKSPY